MQHIQVRFPLKMDGQVLDEINEMNQNPNFDLFARNHFILRRIAHAPHSCAALAGLGNAPGQVRLGLDCAQVLPRCVSHCDFCLLEELGH